MHEINYNKKTAKMVSLYLILHHPLSEVPVNLSLDVFSHVS